MSDIKLPVSEIFYSIDGEGARTGLPVIFIRLFGCNLKCSYCDTRYACEADTLDENGIVSYDLMDFVRILYNIKQYAPCKCITLTGGEPLIHKDVYELILRLRKSGYHVNIETNGAIDLNELIDSQEIMVNPGDDIGGYFITMDWKSISSGETDKMISTNLALLGPEDVLKFVVGNSEDLDQMKAIIGTNPHLQAQVYVSPIFGQIEPADIVAYVLENQLVNVKVQLQLHKAIWDPNRRGV